MALVTITGNTIREAGTRKDNRAWAMRSVAYQYGGGTGGVVTTGGDWQELQPVAGILTFTAEAGIAAFLRTPDNHEYLVRIPEADAGLWDVIEAGIAFPPNTAQDRLDAAVAQYVETNRSDFRTRAVLITEGEDAGKAQWVDESDVPTGDPVEWSQVVSEDIASIAAAAAAPDAVDADLAARDITFTDEGSGEGYFSVGGVPVSGTLVPPAATWSGVAGRPDSAVTAIDRAVNRVIDFTDHGVVGDGTSRPLSGLYGSLAAAQSVYPAAFDLANELDWAAMQSVVDANPGATFLIKTGVHMVTNHPLAPTNDSGWVVDGIIENNRAWDGAIDQNKVFRLGNMHPVILNTEHELAWDTHALDDFEAGDRTITVSTPGGVSLAAGDHVIVRSNTSPVETGVARLYDFQQINKVVSYDSGTGALVLEIPMGEPVGSGETLTGPTLCVNPGGDADTYTEGPWYLLDNFTLSGRGKVMGDHIANRMGMWGGSVQIEGDCRNLLAPQGAVRTRFDVKGSFANRCLEAKFALWECDVRIDGVYKYADLGEEALEFPVTSGEQATGNTFNIRCYRGTEYTANTQILEIAGVKNIVRAELYDYSTGGVSTCVTLRPTRHLLRPPVDNTYDLFIRTIGGKSRYMTVGTDDGDFVNPARTIWNVNALSDGAAPSYVETIYGSGGGLIRGTVVGDALRCHMPDSSVEPPQRASMLAATVTGAPTYTAGTETVGATITLTGVQTGDHLEVGLQSTLAVTSGTFTDLHATATVSGSNTVKVWIRNRSGTDVVIPEGNAYRIWLSWERLR